ncbi:MAG: S9 family peptidase [Anaerolineaceae bacterium]|jgi:dipeptidyl aminopeptidase/acylaminoacyl peptidase
MAQAKGEPIRLYGLWPSSITVSDVSHRITLQDVQWNQDGATLVWLQNEFGAGVLYAKENQEAQQVLTRDQNVRAGVGYGGGDFCVRHDHVVFAERDGRLFQKHLKRHAVKAITPAFGHCASPAISPDGKWVVYVHSDGISDVLGIVDIDGDSWPQILAKGADFYMQPAWHPAGKQLAWIEWDHPNMPWDGTRLMLAEAAGTPPMPGERRLVAGGQDLPVSQPQFSPDGRWLSYIISDGEWEKLVVIELASGQAKTLVEGDGFTLSLPAWIQGIRNYGWCYDNRTLFYTQFAKGRSSIWSVNIADGVSQPVDTGAYTWIPQLAVSPVANQIALLASAPTIPSRVVLWDSNRLQVIARSSPENISPDYLSEPEMISWLAPDGTGVYGLYYSPKNPRYSGKGAPPAIINIHGGPTSSANIGYNAEISYFTSRGYAYVEVNHRGSSGFGRSYQLAQRHRWGLVDVEDAVGAADFLAAQGLADGKRLVISGGSAGGYTVLNALVRHPGRFKAGICRYGVSNLFTLDMDTHKFESRYNDSLIGPLPDAVEPYFELSPAFHAAKIRDPLAIFQGSEDQVVPPEQSEAIVRSLAANGIPHLYRLYQGEGHGFRKPENIADYLQQTEQFMQQHVLFTP